MVNVMISINDELPFRRRNAIVLCHRLPTTATYQLMVTLYYELFLNLDVTSDSDLAGIFQSNVNYHTPTYYCRWHIQYGINARRYCDPMYGRELEFKTLKADGSYNCITVASGVRRQSRSHKA